MNRIKISFNEAVKAIRAGLLVQVDNMCYMSMDTVNRLRKPGENTRTVLTNYLNGTEQFYLLDN